MAKKKNTAAFFEVISKTRQAQKDAGLTIPKWMGKGPEEPAVEQAPVKPSPPKPRQDVAKAATRPAAKPKDPSRSGDRLSLSLSYAACVAGVVGLVVLMAAAFWIGRATAPRAAEVVNAGVVPPFRPDVLAGRQKAPSAPPARDKDKYYLIIERLRGESDEDLTEANRIVAFLAERGLEATVQKFSAGRRTFYGVWSLKAFDADSGAEQTEFAKRIEELGGEYFDKHKTYRFQQRRRPADELTPSYVQPPG